MRAIALTSAVVVLSGCQMGGVVETVSGVFERMCETEKDYRSLLVIAGPLLPPETAKSVKLAFDTIRWNCDHPPKDVSGLIAGLAVSYMTIQQFITAQEAARR